MNCGHAESNAEAFADKLKAVGGKQKLAKWIKKKALWPGYRKFWSAVGYCLSIPQLQVYFPEAHRAPLRFLKWNCWWWCSFASVGHICKGRTTPFSISTGNVFLFFSISTQKCLDYNCSEGRPLGCQFMTVEDWCDFSVLNLWLPLTSATDIEDKYVQCGPMLKGTPERRAHSFWQVYCHPTLQKVTCG